MCYALGLISNDSHWSELSDLKVVYCSKWRDGAFPGIFVLIPNGAPRRETIHVTRNLIGVAS